MKIFWLIALMFVVAVGQVSATQSINLLGNGSFETPSLSGGGSTPDVSPWVVDAVYWHMYDEASLGIPVVDGLQSLYFYIGNCQQNVGFIKAETLYELGIHAMANDLIAPQTSYVVLEAVSPDGARIYELDKTGFGSINTISTWHTFNLSYNNLPGSMLAGYDLRVRIYASGMLSIDDAVLTLTTDQIVIDDFESYKGQLELQENWVALVGGDISMENEFESRFLVHQAMKFEYINQANGFSEVEYDMANGLFGNNLQQSLSGEISLSFCGNRINTPGGQLYLKLQDASGNTYAIYSNTDLTDENWRLWVINLSVFSVAGVDTSDVTKIVLGVKHTQNTAGSGVVYIDDIDLPQLSKKVFNADITLDGIVDINDLVVLVQNWLMAY